MSDTESENFNEVIINGFRHIPFRQREYSAEELEMRSSSFLEILETRRSVRHFSDKMVSESVIKNLILTAGTAPSGAHKQPWKFCAVSSKEIKRKIRIAAEEEEQQNYNGRMSDQWLKDLAPLATNSNKDFLETAPWLIVVFKEIYELDEQEDRKTNYYVNESVGIACGILISAIHQAGLATLTHTPSPMNFLADILDRPKNERAYLLLPVGYASEEAIVPDLKRKNLNEISTFYK